MYLGVSAPTTLAHEGICACKAERASGSVGAFGYNMGSIAQVQCSPGPVACEPAKPSDRWSEEGCTGRDHTPVFEGMGSALGGPEAAGLPI